MSFQWGWIDLSVHHAGGIKGQAIKTLVLLDCYDTVKEKYNKFWSVASLEK